MEIHADPDTQHCFFSIFDSLVCTCTVYNVSLLFRLQVWWLRARGPDAKPWAVHRVLGGGQPQDLALYIRGELFQVTEFSLFFSMCTGTFIFPLITTNSKGVPTKASVLLAFIILVLSVSLNVLDEYRHR